MDHKSKPKKPTLTSCKSIDLQVPQVTSERRHSLVGLNILLPEKKRFSLKRSKSTCDLDDQEYIDKDKQKSDNNAESKSDTENNENGKKFRITSSINSKICSMYLTKYIVVIKIKIYCASCLL